MTIASTRQIKARLLIGRPDGQTWEDLTEFLRYAEVSFGIDGETVRQLSFDLIGASFSPRDKTSPWNTFNGQYSPLLWPNREVILDVATPAIGEEPVWQRLFHGYLGDEITVNGGIVSCLCRDLAKRLQDCYIEELRTYGSEEGTPAENVIQAIIDDNLGAGKVSLYCPVSPGFMVRPYQVEYKSVWDAIKEVAAQIGWYLGYLWDEQTNEYRLTLMEPPRDKETADFAFDYEDDIYVQELSIDDADIRNVVRVTYQDAATRQRSTVLVEDLASIAEYGRRAMQIEEGDASLIDSEQEALALANAALADLKDLTATTQITLPLFPEVSIFDGIAVQNPRTSSTVDFYGVESVRHILDFDGGLFRTELVAAGRVVGSHRQWLEMETRPGAPGLPPGPPTTNQEPPAITGLQARAAFNGVELRFNPVVSPYLDAYEIEHYVEPDTEWKLLASGKDTYYRFEFPAHSVVHLRVRARFYTGAVGPWSTTLVVSPRSLTEEEMGGELFSISVSSDPEPLTGELESLWDMDESTGVTFPSGPVTITFRYPVQQGTDMVRVHLGSAATGYFQMLDEDAWVNILGSETEPVSLAAGWNVRRLPRMHYGREYRMVLNDPVQVNELKFWRVTLADEILAQKMNLTGDLAISAGEGAVVMDAEGVRGYKGEEKTFEIDNEGNVSLRGAITAGDGNVIIDDQGITVYKDGDKTFEAKASGDVKIKGQVEVATGSSGLSNFDGAESLIEDASAGKAAKDKLDAAEDVAKVVIDEDGITVINTDGSYSRLKADTVAFYEPGATEPSHYVRRTAMGTASDGEWVALNWSLPPKVVVSLRQIQTFVSEQSDKSQLVDCYISPDPPDPEGFYVYAFTKVIEGGVEGLGSTGSFRPDDAPFNWYSNYSTGNTTRKVQVNITLNGTSGEDPGGVRYRCYYQKSGDSTWTQFSDTIIKVQGLNKVESKTVYSPALPVGNYRVRIHFVAEAGGRQAYGWATARAIKDAIIYNGEVNWHAVEGGAD